MGVEVGGGSGLVAVFGLLIPFLLGSSSVLDFGYAILGVLSLGVWYIIQYSLVSYSRSASIESMPRIGLSFSSHLVDLIVACS